ncbi:MAG: hypothetical protein ABSA82_03190 [Thermacetogeniaceae bacterium]|jgi:uncharacterized phage infection (PIP) family protein YhgE
MEYSNILVSEKALTGMRQRGSDLQTRFMEEREAINVLKEQIKSVLANLGDASSLAALRGELAARQELSDEAWRQRNKSETDAQIIADQIKELHRMADDLRQAIAEHESRMLKSNWESQLIDIERQQGILQNGRKADEDRLKQFKESGAQRQLILNYEQRLARGGYWSDQELDLKHKRSIIQQGMGQDARQLAELKERLARLEQEPE